MTVLVPTPLPLWRLPHQRSWGLSLGRQPCQGGSGLISEGRGGAPWGHGPALPNTKQIPNLGAAGGPADGGSGGCAECPRSEETGEGCPPSGSGLHLPAQGQVGAGPWRREAFQSLPCPAPPRPCPLPELTATLVAPGQEFENAEGEEYVADFSAQGSPAAAAQNGPDVYVLPLTEVSLPMAKQPGRSGELLAGPWGCCRAGSGLRSPAPRKGW